MDHGCLFPDIGHKLKCSACGQKNLKFVRTPKGNENRVPVYRGNPYARAKGE